MTTLLEAAKKALEALETYECCPERVDIAITTLRTAIEAAENQEPVARVVDGGFIKFLANGKDFPAVGTLLYTHPAPAIEAIEPFDASDNRFREAFEESIRSGNYPLTRKGYGYRSPMTQMAFDISFATVNRLKLYINSPSAEIEATEIGNEIN